MKKVFLALLPLFDVLVVVFVYPSALLLKLVRWVGVQRLPLSKNALFQVGVFPINKHYYEPGFNITEERRPLSQERVMPGIDWNVEEQIKILDTLKFSEEIKNITKEQPNHPLLDPQNTSFCSGDAEYWYQMIRSKKPRKIYEIGSGYSTLIAINATDKNKADDPKYECMHVCIEPYPATWLMDVSATVIQQKVEDMPVDFFSTLEKNDILFIDSSHIIHPDGDVLFEYLEILPTLKKGTIVHIHDIFSPRNYLKRWLIDYVLFWNEQYLLEAFLTHNSSWKIIGSLNYLHHNHYDHLKKTAPFLTPDREPGSFYIQKIT
jgi:hypothetical protein